MKNVLFLCTILFTTFISFSQPPSIQVDNQTNCTMYVDLYELDLDCNITVHNVAISPNSVTTVNASIGGYFEYARVTDTFGPVIPSCYYVEIEVPWANCPQGFNHTEAGNSCCVSSPVIKSSWLNSLSSATQPHLIIF